MLLLTGFETFIKNILKAKAMMITIPIIIVFTAITVGLIANHFTHKDDGPIEQIAEVVIERELEQFMHLENGTLDGKIDLSPEDLGEIANEKIKDAKDRRKEMDDY